MILNLDLQFGLGFFVPSTSLQLGGPQSFGHFGAGGSAGWADPEAELGFGYVMNKMDLGLAGDLRSYGLVNACYDAIRDFYGLRSTTPLRSNATNSTAARGSRSRCWLAARRRRPVRGARSERAVAARPGVALREVDRRARGSARCTRTDDSGASGDDRGRRSDRAAVRRVVRFVRARLLPQSALQRRDAYRDPRDAVAGRHRRGDPDHGRERPFLVQRRDTTARYGARPLPASGDLMVFGGRFQADWLHGVRSAAPGARPNLDSVAVHIQARPA